MLTSPELNALKLTQDAFARLLETISPITTEVGTGSGSATLILVDFCAALYDRFGLLMRCGSLNLYTPKPLALPDPIRLVGKGIVRPDRMHGFVSPVVLNGQALGFVLRFEDGQQSEFIEVFSDSVLRDRLALQRGDDLSVQFLPSSILPRA